MKLLETEIENTRQTLNVLKTCNSFFFCILVQFYVKTDTTGCKHLLVTLIHLTGQQNLWRRIFTSVRRLAIGPFSQVRFAVQSINVETTVW